MRTMIWETEAWQITFLSESLHIQRKESKEGLDASIWFNWNEEQCKGHWRGRNMNTKSFVRTTGLIWIQKFLQPSFEKKNLLWWSQWCWWSSQIRKEMSFLSWLTDFFCGVQSMHFRKGTVSSMIFILKSHPTCLSF